MKAKPKLQKILLTPLQLTMIFFLNEDDGEAIFTLQRELTNFDRLSDHILAQLVQGGDESNHTAASQSHCMCALLLLELIALSA